jgi:hypothetical protein
LSLYSWPQRQSTWPRLYERQRVFRVICREIYCIILDRQTTEDRTALLVKTKRDEADSLPLEDEEKPIVKVRETFKEANGLITSASVGLSSLVQPLWNQQGSKSR